MDPKQLAKENRNLRKRCQELETQMGEMYAENREETRRLNKFNVDLQRNNGDLAEALALARLEILRLRGEA